MFDIIVFQSDNLRFENVKAIDAKIEKQRQQLLKVIETEHSQAAHFMDRSVWLHESALMGQEDSLSLACRQRERTERSLAEFSKAKRKMLLQAEEEKQRFSQDMRTMHEAYETFQQRAIEEKKLQVCQKSNFIIMHYSFLFFLCIRKIFCLKCCKYQFRLILQ